MVGINIGYGPMAVGSRWLAYASNSPFLGNTGLSPQSVTPPTVSPSTSPSGGNLVAKYAMESSKHLASGLIKLGDIGYKTLSKYYHNLIVDGSNSAVSSNSSWKVSQHHCAFALMHENYKTSKTSRTRDGGAVADCLALLDGLLEATFAEQHAIQLEVERTPASPLLEVTPVPEATC